MECPICQEDAGETPVDLIEHTNNEHVFDDAQTTFGGRCEDYPCCGHEAGDCPVYSPGSGYLRYPCLGCGKRIKCGSSDDAGSSYCRRCLNNPRTYCEGPECPGCSYCLNERDDEDEDYE